MNDKTEQKLIRIVYIIWVLGLMCGIFMIMVGNVWGYSLLAMAALSSAIWSIDRLIDRYKEWKKEKAFKLEMGIEENRYTELMKISKQELGLKVLLCKNGIMMLSIISILFAFIIIVMLLTMNGIIINSTIFGLILVFGFLLLCIILGEGITSGIRYNREAKLAKEEQKVIITEIRKLME